MFYILNFHNSTLQNLFFTMDFWPKLLFTWSQISSLCKQRKYKLHLVSNFKMVQMKKVQPALLCQQSKWFASGLFHFLGLLKQYPRTSKSYWTEEAKDRSFFDLSKYYHMLESQNITTLHVGGSKYYHITRLRVKILPHVGGSRAVWHASGQSSIVVQLVPEMF